MTGIQVRGHSDLGPLGFCVYFKLGLPNKKTYKENPHKIAIFLVSYENIKATIVGNYNTKYTNYPSCVQLQAAEESSTMFVLPITYRNCHSKK